MLRFNLNLYRLAADFKSTEETRYYLNGVFVEPHHSGSGVTLTATDGHRLVCIYDAEGYANESAIINLGKVTKPKSGMTRIVHIHSDDDRALINEGLTGSELSTFTCTGSINKVRVDGTYPDYRRVIPDTFKTEEVPAYNGTYLADFGELADQLAIHEGHGRKTSSNTLRMIYSDSSPALILFPNYANAFGVLMPVRCDDKPVNLPRWFRAPTPIAEAA